MGGENIIGELQKLKNMLSEAKKLPFSKYVSVDRDEFISIISKIEFMLPNEVKEAFLIKAKRDEILKQAAEESERLINEAREKQKYYLSQSSIMQEAEKEKQKIIQDAQLEAEALRREAEKYVYDILNKLDEYIDRVKEIIIEGKRELGNEDSNC